MKGNAMRRVFLTLTLIAASASAQEPALDWQGWFIKGEEAFKAAHYQEAAEDFQKSIALNPSALAPHLYLGKAWIAMYIPGATSTENIELSRSGEQEIQRVLQMDPYNIEALESLASLTLHEAQGATGPSERSAKLDEAASLYERLATADPTNKDAYYSLAVIDWTKWYPAYMAIRNELGMAPADPGPIPNAAVRKNLSQQYGKTLEQGIAQLTKAIEIDPSYSDAMAYLNLLIRERADLRDTVEAYKTDVQTADDWVQRALDAKKAHTTAPRFAIGAPPPPPPPPPPPLTTANASTPQRIRVGGNVQAQNLIQKVDPDYPPLARSARIQGTVRFTAIIARDGRIQNLQLVSGHPLLVESARQAVEQWVYRPTLLNGQPVEVVTQIDVNFALQ